MERKLLGNKAAVSAVNKWYAKLGQAFSLEAVEFLERHLENCIGVKKD